jgi:tetratricopeptide (TPR) repeat protein
MTTSRIARELARWPAGLHELGAPATWLPPEWPASLAEVYRAFDGARLFHEAIELVPAAEVALDDGRWRIGSAWGDELAVDGDGRVWRHEADGDEPLLDGTSLPRWLSGAIDAEALLFDADGEFAEDVFDEEGDLAPGVEVARLRARIKRDPKAPGPRWTLARRLTRDGQHEEARDLLEAVVADAPDLPWAWLDLARISETLGELPGALDEAVAAAEAATGGDHEAFFWSHAARIAAALGDEARRAELAGQARAADPQVVASYLAGAEENLASGDAESATMLAELAKAVAPKDLAVLDLVRKLSAG